MDYYGSMMLLPRAPAVLAGLLLTLASHGAMAQAASAPQPASAASEAKTPAQSALDARLMYELLVSEMILQAGDAQTASTFMLDAARRTGNESLFKRATEMAIQSRSGPAALEATRAWHQAAPGSVEAGQYELQVLIVMGRIPETEEPLRRFVATLPGADKVSFLNAVPQLYQRAPDKALAARTVENGLSDALKNPALAAAAWTSVGRMRLQANDRTGALSAATLAQGADASSEWPALLGLQLMLAGEPQAEALVKRYLSHDSAKPEVHIGYARALVEQSRSADAHAELNQLIRLQPAYPEAWLVQGALYADERKDADAEAALRRYLALADQPTSEGGANRSAGRNQARMMLARIAERRGDFASAEQLLAAVDAPEQALAVQTRRAALLARQGRIDEARQAIRSAPERDPEDARQKLLAEAQLLRDHQQPAEAYRLLSEELKNDPNDENLLYDAAMAAERAGRHGDMERLLRRHIELKPELPHAYNALGYSLADRGVRLTEAKALVEKAVELAPDDPFIQDSLGWVEFRLGHRQEALRLLEAAYRKRPDPEIAAHLGEVMWVLGDQEGARQVWREGLQLDATHDALRETLKRLQVTP